MVEITVYPAKPIPVSKGEQALRDQFASDDIAVKDKSTVWSNLTANEAAEMLRLSRASYISQDLRKRLEELSNKSLGNNAS